MDDYKRQMMKNIGPGGLHCYCCNSSRGKLKNSHIGKNNSLNKVARKRLKIEDAKNDNSIKSLVLEKEYIHEKADHIDIIDCIDEFNEYDTGFKNE